MVYYSTGWLTDMQKIGVGLSATGGMFLLFGCFLLFNRKLLCTGNALFLLGLLFIIGPKKTVSFFLRRNKWRGTAAFVVGLTLIIYKYAILGMFVECFGFLSLFGDFFPYLLAFVRKLPVIGTIFSHRIIANYIDRVCGTRLPV